MWSNWGNRAATVLGVSAFGVYAIDLNTEKRIKYLKGNYSKRKENENIQKIYTNQLPSRKELVEKMKNVKEFDILVIGGGATGAGIAMDAQTRGLTTALVESKDYASGHSTKPSKLLLKEVTKIGSSLTSYKDLRVLKNDLNEMQNLIKCAPHLSKVVPALIPAYEWYEVPIFFLGAKLHDMIAGRRVLKPAKYMAAKDTLEKCAILRTDNLKGSLLYYDAIHDHARLVLSVIVTAIRSGAVCMNHTKADSLIIDDNGKVIGAKIEDKITGEEYEIRAKSVINATGDKIDSIRKMANENAIPMSVRGSEVYVTIPGYFCPGNVGICNIGSEKVVYATPWQNRVVIGTTDTVGNPMPSNVAIDDEIDFILTSLNKCINPEYRIKKDDIVSNWRVKHALVQNKRGPGDLTRTHVIEIDPSGLVTVVGGEITVFRNKAEELIDKCVERFKLKPTRGCSTFGMQLEGAHYWSPMLYSKLVRKYGIDEETARHLSNVYGDNAPKVLKFCESTGKEFPRLGKRLHPDFPHLEAEVRYSIREYAATAIDFIARRTRLCFLDVHAAREILPKVVYIMAQELNWSEVEQKRQYDMCLSFLKNHMGLDYNKKCYDMKQCYVSEAERIECIRRFQLVDKGRNGYITGHDLSEYLKENGQFIDQKILNDVVEETGAKCLYYKDFEKLYSGIKCGNAKGRRLMDYLRDLEPCSEHRQFSENVEKCRPKPHLEDPITLL